MLLIRYLTLALLLICAHPVTAHAAAQELNPYGGKILDPIDWSAMKPGKTGDNKGELQSPDKKENFCKYRIFTPDNLPEKNHLSLLLCFHGKGGSENGPADFMYKNIKNLGLDQQYIVLGLKAINEGWEDHDEINVLRAYEWATSVYPIDPRRVYLLGHSSGAYWDTKFGLKHMDKIAGVMRWAGGSIRPTVIKDGPWLTEWYLVHGTKDDQNSINGSREARDKLKQAEYRYILREVLEGDHGNILRMMDITNDMVWWMDSLRHKTMPLTPEDEDFLKQFSKAKEAAKLFMSPAAWEELLRIGGPHAGQVIAMAMKSDKPKVREFAAIACSKNRFAGEETVALLEKLLSDKKSEVRSAALKALGVAANWRSEHAQMALGRLALNGKSKSVTLQERGEATVYLAQAAKLPLLGNYDDDMPVWQALLTLMNDERREIREAAFAPFKVAVPDGLGYDPALSEEERAGAISKWQAWFTTHMVSDANKQAKR